MGLLQVTLRSRLKNKALERYPWQVGPSEDLSQLSFLSGICPGFPKVGIAPQDTAMRGSWMPAAARRRVLRLWNISRRNAEVPAEAIERVYLSNNIQSLLWEEQIRLHYINPHLGAEDWEGARVRSAWLSRQEMAALRKMNITSIDLPLEQKISTDLLPSFQI